MPYTITLTQDEIDYLKTRCPCLMPGWEGYCVLCRINVLIDQIDHPVSQGRI